MSKPRRSRRKLPSDSDEYCPGRTDIEKRESRKLASAAYYARNVHLREKNRLKMRERRTAAKAYRRQWDPPKANKPPSNAGTDHEDTDAHQECVSWCGRPRLSGYNADGRSEYSCHYMDFRGVTETSAPRSYWRLRDRLASRPHSLGGSTDERVAVEVLASMVWRRSGAQELDKESDNCTDRSALVQAAAAALEALNSGPWTPPTPAEQGEWVRKKRNFRGDYLTWKELLIFAHG
ncbi:hypothetical protein B0H14DRAFT_2763962, partial [Mycena olivaceomarginata]